jgi:hypothetical protein
MESLSQLSSMTCRARRVTYSNMMKLCVRSKRRTDAFTKMLMPGTNTREISACACNRNRVLLIERFCVASHSSKVPKRMKQSGSSPADSRMISWKIQTTKIVMKTHCKKNQVRMCVIRGLACTLIPSLESGRVQVAEECSRTA